MARFFFKFVKFIFEFYSFFKKARYLKFIFNFILFLKKKFMKKNYKNLFNY